MCCFYWLINKETALVCNRAECRIELGGKTKLNAGRKKVDSKRRHVAGKGERCEPPARTLLVGHEPRGKIQNNRNGLI